MRDIESTAIGLIGMYFATTYRRILAFMLVLNLAIPLIGLWKFISVYHAGLRLQSGSRTELFELQSHDLGQAIAGGTLAIEEANAPSHPAEVTAGVCPDCGSNAREIFPSIGPTDVSESAVSLGTYSDHSGHIEYTLSKTTWFYGTLSLLSLAAFWAVFIVLRRHYIVVERREERVRCATMMAAAISQHDFLKYTP